ncbi:MAG: metallo-mystery pair system four-Cys motif protein [Fluviicoccus sp.]|uniref:MbnP family copper-binding protein n=1 Tax=Fluviicoccus sp. TaxID=2003552 RepID=UPI0027223CEC|nr:MbnP family copper-binding protein [Fluviicoccus sp.]MDO8328860.1 metallo-mystery pair system four-Cys motif protein [Fluviicoccus sp.]
MRALVSATIIPSLFLAACGGSSDSNSTAVVTTTQAVSIQFAAQANGADITCASNIAAISAGNPAMTLKDLRYYVSDVRLINNKGEEVAVKLDQNPVNPNQYLNVAMLDFENGLNSCAGGSAETNTTITGKVPSGTYTGLMFTVGVPVSAVDADGKTVSLNHSDYATAPAPLDSQALAWSWQSGRKFLKLEVNPVGGVTKPDTTVAPTFNVHLGSTGCTGNPAGGEAVTCTKPNRMSVRLTSFNIATQKAALDLNGLLGNSNLTKDEGGPVGCMSGADAECTPIFTAMQIDQANGQPINLGTSQTVFKAVAK